MNPTTRCPFRRGSRCALAVSILLLGALGSTSIQPAIAADDFGLAEVDFYSDAGGGAQQGPFQGTYDIGPLLGADRFYSAGYNGASTVIANIEAGYIWNEHEALSHVQLMPNSFGAAGEIDRHATAVGLILGGRSGGASPGPYQIGMAPGAQLFSGGIATSWPSSSLYPRFTTAFYLNTGISTFGPFHAAFVDGLAVTGGTRTADVVNVSWQWVDDFSGHTASDAVAGTLDAMVYENPRTLLVMAAGNTPVTATNPNGGMGPNRVPSPGSAFNGLTVAALAPNGGAFNVASSFSNGGPNDYYDPVNGSVSEAHAVVDLAAPGEGIATAYYGGQMGGNGTNVYGPANGPDGGPDWYLRSVAGTSFATPTVSGGAALLYDAAYDVLGGSPQARDTRVIKAVLMNSADKTLGWDNGQVAHPNGNGGVLTTQSLDDRVGTGRMNLSKAFDQYLSGTTDVAGTASGLIGTVENAGWDYGLAADGATNDYLFDRPLLGGSTFTATLDWFRQRQTYGLSSSEDISFDNLDLELWSAAAGSPLGPHFRIEKRLQQRRAFQLRDSDHRRVHAESAADGRDF